MSPVNSPTLDQPRTAETDGPDLPLTVRVADRRLVAGDVVVLTLQDPTGRPLPWWAPGAHIALRIGEQDLVREYSLCGSPRDRGSWTIAVRLAEAGRGGSRHIHDHLHPGDRVVVERIANHFEFRPSARPCFVAGGIGITPLLAMLEAAQRYGADWNLIYLGRDRGRMPFLERLEGYGDRVRVVETSRQDRFTAAEIVAENPGSHIFSCGPESLLQALTEVTRTAPDVSLTVERFTPRAVETPEQETGFDVVIGSTGRTVRVDPDRSTLAALLEAGVAVPNSCGEGTCGSCETVVVSGTPDHRDSILSDEERETGECMYVCVSRSRSPRLVLDL